MDDINLLCILDYLDLGDLLSLAELSPRLLAIIRDHYMIPKYHIHRKVRFTNDRMNTYLDTLIVSDTDILLRLFRVYGDLITTFDFIRCRLDHNQLQTISQHIEQYSAESIIELNLNDVGDYFLCGTTRQFSAVKRLNFWSYRDISCTPQLSETFPNLDTLELNAGMMYKLPQIHQTHSNLKHFTFTESNELIFDEYLENFIRLHPQLQGLHLNRLPDMDLMNWINANLVDLQYFSIAYQPLDIAQWYAAYNARIRFENVTEFTVKIKMSEPFDEFSFIFDRLEVLRIELTSNYHVPMALIQQNSHVRRLSIPLQFVTNRQQFVDAIRQFSALEELSTNWCSEINDDIIQLVADVKTLKRVAIMVHNHVDARELFDAMSMHEWHFVGRLAKDISFTEFVFQR